MRLFKGNMTRRDIEEMVKDLKVNHDSFCFVIFHGDGDDVLLNTTEEDKFYSTGKFKSVELDPVHLQDLQINTKWSLLLGNSVLNPFI